MRRRGRKPVARLPLLHTVEPVGPKRGEARPCTPSPTGVWTAMSTEDAPELGEIFDARSAFLAPTRWWLWNAHRPLGESRAFDGECNRWDRIPPAAGVTLPDEWDRRVQVLFGDRSVVVLGPTWVQDASGLSAGPFRAFVLDGRALEWTELSAVRVMSRESRVVLGKHRAVVFGDGSAHGFVVDANAATAEAFDALPPIVGRGYDCMWVLDDAWLIANPKGVFRLDFAQKTWSTLHALEPPMATHELGACLLTRGGDGSYTATTRSLYEAERSRSFSIAADGRTAGPRIESTGEAADGAALASREEAPPGFAVQADGEALRLVWGRIEMRSGNNCHNPFNPTPKDPRDPICTPSRAVKYHRVGPGGQLFRSH